MMKKVLKAVKESSAGLILSFALSFLAFIYAPFELYLTNISEFWMKPANLIPALVLLSGFSFCVFSFILIISQLINKNLYRFNLTWISALLVGFYIQGNFLIKNLPSMGGETIEWELYTSERIKSALAFIVPFAVFIVLFIVFRKGLFEKIVKILSICLSLLLAVTLTTLFVTTDTNKNESLVPTMKNEFQLSKDQNLIIFIVDAYDSGYFKEVMAQDTDFQNGLDGFTFYENALSAYPFTTHSIPMILSGEWFENDGDFSKYLIESVDKSPLINVLEKNNYNIGIYEQSALNLEENTFEGRFDNCSRVGFDYTGRSVYKLVLKMAGVKFAPWDLKKECEDLSEMVVKCRVPSSGDKQFIWSNVSFYKQIKNDNPIEVTDNKCARIIHVEGAHVPYKYDKNVNRIDPKTGSYTQNVEACATMIKQYLKRLRESEVYDNSAIVILGDHGYAGNDKKDEYNLKKRMNPVVLVKGIGEKHALKSSSAPIMYTDLAQGFVKLTEKKASDEIFDWKDNDSRNRRMLVFAYTKEDHIREYYTDGRADDPDAMKATGKEYVLGK